MNKNKIISTKNDFIFNWVLINELAVGSAPKKSNDINKLKNSGIKSIIKLSTEEEDKTLPELEKSFNHKLLILPDHRTGTFPSLSKLKEVLIILEELMKEGSVFVHCHACMERSPLICTSWLVKEKKLNPIEALEYMKQVNPSTNLLTEQLKLITKSEKFFCDEK